MRNRGSGHPKPLNEFPPALQEIYSSSGVDNGEKGVSPVGSDLTNGGAALDPVLACPSTLSDLTDGFRSYGGALSVLYKSSKKLPGTRVR